VDLDHQILIYESPAWQQICCTHLSFQPSSLVLVRATMEAKEHAARRKKQPKVVNSGE
jgi:hypothetical protein